MSNKEFETKVLSALDWLKDDVSWLKGDIMRLDKKIDTNYDRLENIINNQTDELKIDIKNQGKYLNQAFDIITTMQNDQLNNKNKKYFA